VFTEVAGNGIVFCHSVITDNLGQWHLFILL